jgi:hypothetical protein
MAQLKVGGIRSSLILKRADVVVPLGRKLCPL